MQKDNHSLHNDLSHVYWIGGSPCAGKSSIADHLANKYGFQIYRCDEAYYTHMRMVTPEEQPTFHRLIHLSSEDLWMRPVKEQTREERAFYREESPLILDDLRSLPRSKPILAEGAALLPECVSNLLPDPERAIWIVPTKEFQLYHYRQREWAKEIVKDCKDPEQAFLNWMQRDIEFAHTVACDANERAMHVLWVDGSHTLAENAAFVEQHFRL